VFLGEMGLGVIILLALYSLLLVFVTIFRGYKYMHICKGGEISLRGDYFYWYSMPFWRHWSRFLGILVRN